MDFCWLINLSSSAQFLVIINKVSCNLLVMKSKAIKLHLKNPGKFEIKPTVKLKTKKDLALAYTPGVAEPCLEIAKDKKKLYDYTSKKNSVLVVSDGSAVLGLGNIGVAGLPVMEGKAVLFKKFGGINAVPLMIKSQDTKEILKVIRNIADNFGGINLEDFSAPRCFEIEATLKKELDIPVFHDDQHGTAIVVLAGLFNSLKIVKKKLSEIKVVVNGAGAAGIAISKLLLRAGVKNLVVLDSKGAIYYGRKDLNKSKREIGKWTNKESYKGYLKGALVEADVFIGVSKAGILKGEMIKSMNKDSIVFGLANPVPEIMPEIALKAGARIVATGRSDFPNQINNVLVFPGIFRGALDSRVKNITDEMKLEASKAIAGLVGGKLKESYIIPGVFDKRVSRVVAKAVSRVA